MTQDRATQGPVDERSRLILMAGTLALVLAAACGQPPLQSSDTPVGANLATFRAWPGSPPPASTARLRAAEGKLVPELADASEAVTARVSLPARANGQTHVEDRATGLGIDIAVVGANASAAQVIDGYVVYPRGHALGWIYQRAEPSGVEDYVVLEQRPGSPSIAYDVALGAKVAGLRLLENQLEMLDDTGAPRLRLAPPYVVGSDGARTDALLAVQGCAVDTEPAGPWGRTVTPPGARRCRVRVSWADDAVVYPALLDPRWQTTGSMSVARQDHDLIYLPLTGKVLAVGGRSSPTSTTGLASAELFDKNTGTWSATSSMSGGRWSASATLLGSSSNGTTGNKVLIAGGINGTASVNTARLYNQTAGTWAAAGTLNAPRHLHTATLLSNGRVLVCGGMNGSTVLTSAALYNPASGSGSWAATTGPIPPPGWRSGTATLIQTSNGQLNNKVLLAGGNNGTSSISAVFLFDPAQSAFSTLASMPSPREGHQAVTLSDGRILFSGGKNGSTYLASSVIFDPSWGPGNWTTAGNMTSPRWGHAMNLLPTAVLHLGLVLVSGGSNGTSTLSSTEYWNGTNWATDGAMVAPVQRHGSVALGNSILIAGGAINNGSTTVSAAEVYDPSIGLGCTSGSQCASGFCVSGVCCDSACNGGCGSCNLAGHLGTCTPLTIGSVCRALAEICDAAETCDGSSLACPANAFQPSTTECRASAGVCDVAESCTGASVTCPADAFQPPATVCRTAVSQCDVTESCLGASAACPTDDLQPDETTCDDGNGETSGDACSMGQCQGTVPCSAVASVASGGTHTCGLRTDGSLWCWGEGTSGQLGYQSYQTSRSPVRAGSSTWRWSSVTAGLQHSCGIRIDQTLWCWGGNGFGQLGVGGSGDVASPEQVDGQGWSAVQAGRTHTCATRNDGSLWCWGENAHGALGDGTLTNSSLPVQVSGGDWVHVAMGGGHTCAVKGDHTLWCWGLNADGQLGIGSTAESSMPIQVDGTTWAAVTAGEDHTCALKLDGSLWCWGANEFGQLGTSPTDPSLPSPVGAATWTSVSAGLGYTCALRDGGTLWCWGTNDAGQLGDGTTASKPVPVRIIGQGWATVSADQTHTCGHRQDGSLWCWGANDQGQLGDGGDSASLVPKQVAVELCSQVPICGNGTLEDGEECDDGNNAAEDGCSPLCQVEKCFGVVCDPSTVACHANVCDPATGACVDQTLADGAGCDDANACTQTDVCVSGTCFGGNSVVCPDPNSCQQPGTCEPATGACSYPARDRIDCNVFLRVDGVVNTGDDHWIAVFGWDSTAATQFRPETTNSVTITPAPPNTPSPPAYLIPGSHPGGFLAPFTTGQTISWTVDSRTVTSTGAPQLTPSPLPTGGGQQVELPDGTKVTITPDMDAYQRAVPETTPAEEPPVAAAFNGVIAGQLSVGPSGEAIYTVPIAIPPGIGGMAPNLNLVYNSQGMDGIAGQGWSLSGLSVVHRCAKTRLQDGYAKTVDLDSPSVGDESGDGVCLDGKRLFIREQREGCTYYEMEFAEFNEIVYCPADGFQVTTKSGEVRTYGRYQAFSLGGWYGGIPVPAIWALEKVTDPWGNFYRLVYDDNVFYGLRVTSIAYTGHVASCENCGEDSPFHTITFDYEPNRPDRRNVRFGADQISIRHHLKSITTPRGIYKLTYVQDATAQETKMLPSRLGKIEYCSTVGPDPKPCAEPLEFEWEAGGYAWVGAPDYQPPTTVVGNGTLLMDLDGDGRPEFIAARDGRALGVWRNTGNVQTTCPATPVGSCWDDGEPPLGGTVGWQLRPNWVLPGKLASSDGEIWGVVLADFDNDGLPDLIADRDPNNGEKPQVYRNRIRLNDGAGWGTIDGLSGNAIANLLNALPGPYDGGGNELADPNWRTLDLKPGADRVIDMDGDGRADIVHFASACVATHAHPGCAGRKSVHALFVLRNEADQWVVDPAYTIWIADFSIEQNYFNVVDLNRDGLPDVKGQVRKLNSGDSSSGSVWKDTPLYQGSAAPKYVPTADVDGDGRYDSVKVVYPPWEYDKPIPKTSVEFAFGTSRGWIDNTFGYGAYYLSLGAATHTETWEQRHSLEGGKIKLLDINADGLADAVVSHTLGGRLLVNTGWDWSDYDGYSNYSAADGADGHYVPNALSTLDMLGGTRDHYGNIQLLDEFVDLDGDGVTDRIQTLAYWPGEGGYKRRAWLNTFRPPVIKRFPNGLAARSEVTYSTITSLAAKTLGVYTDTAALMTGPAATKYVMAPLRVVATVTRDDGIGATADTTYKYFDLRDSGSHHGSQGFRAIEVHDPSGMVTRTTYGQRWPYTGRVTSVTREHPDHGMVTNTHTGYDIMTLSQTPARNMFVYAFQVTDKAYLSRLGENQDAEEVTTVTDYTYDPSGYGNPTLVVVTTTGADGTKYRRTVDNTYGSDGSAQQDDLERMGKVTKTITTTEQLGAPSGKSLAPTKQHTTMYKYGSMEGQPMALPLVKKLVEAGAGAPLEMHVAYEYDKWGNLITSTSCASDFDDCTPGATNPSEAASTHPPFRTTRVSYTVADFAEVAANGNSALLELSDIQYGNGRYPVKTTNAAGHTEHSAYNPLWGSLIQSTGPNRVYTCYKYDALGAKTKEIARCGSADPISTTFARYKTTGSQLATAPTVVVTRPLNGATTWAYSDTLGRPVKALSRSFDGNFVAALTEYDHLGHVYRTSKPFFPGQTQYWTTTQYDGLDRVSSVEAELGDIDGVDAATPVPAKSTKTMYYDGSWTSTAETVAGDTRSRSERRNVLGKVSVVSDALGSSIQYTYDVEGNLADTTYTGDAPNPTSYDVHIEYDLRGRKKKTVDPDAGTWEYTYNGFGDLIRQKDANLQTVDMTYDELGRLRTKSDATGKAEWVYDAATSPGHAGVGKLAAMISAPDNSRLKAPCTVPYVSQTSEDPDASPPSDRRAGRWFAYNEFGDVSETFECVDGETFSTQYEYDDRGRQSVLRYPEVNGSRFAVKYNYTSLGFLKSVSDPSAPADRGVYWQALAVNAAGQVVDEQTRNGVETISTPNPSTGWLLGRTTTAHADGDNLIQGLAYKLDEAGNVLLRTRSEPRDMADSEETFVYDRLDRLTSAQVKVPSQGYDMTESYTYDSLGNLLQKGGKGYSYTGCQSGGGPHAVCSVGGGTAFAYDANGNLTSGRDRDLVYNAANKVVEIASHPTPSQGNDNGTVSFVYGADGNRVVQLATGANLSSRTVYVGLGGSGRSIYERTTTTDQTAPEAPATVEHVQFVYAAGAQGAFALRVLTEDGSSGEAMKYNHFDHLGSVNAITDERGRVVSQGAGGPNASVMGYDAWGARRNPDGTAATPASFNLQAGHREYTGHEAIPNVSLVNMNGRVYDPELARFVSPDPNVQFVANLQSYNRYSYVLNNPLRYTDPTGYMSVPVFPTNATWFVALEFAAMGIACAATYGAGCVAFAVAGAAFMTTTAILNGADPAQTIALGVMSFALGYAGGAVVGAATSSVAGQVIGGGVSAAVVSGISAAAAGQSGGDLGRTMFLAFVQGAAAAAAASAVNGMNQVSEDSMLEAAGEGGGTDADLVQAEAQQGEAANSTETAEKGNKHRIVNCGGEGNPACGSARAPNSRDQRAIAFYNSEVDENLPVSEAARRHGIEYGKVAVKTTTGDIREGKLSIGTGRKVDYDWKLRPGESTDAFYHAHPGRIDGDKFSAGDIDLARKHHAPHYLLTPEGKVFVFEPSVGKLGTITQINAPDSLLPRISGNLL